MKYRFDNRRLPLLWRTIFLLTIVVVISQIVIYIWVQRSVSGHFEQMDSEIITHAAFNLRKRADYFNERTTATLPLSSTPSAPLYPDDLHASWSDYNLKILVIDRQGHRLSSAPSGFAHELPADFDLWSLWQTHREQQFVTKINDRNYRAVLIKDEQILALIALPIDVHHQYLLQFNRQLSLILLAITLLLVSVAALSVYWGFAPLSTIVQKMQGINPERLDERVSVSDMPRELRPLAESYNLMMSKLEGNFASLLRFSDNIAHELRTPLATLGTQTQVMLSKTRDTEEYIEQLHHQHDTLQQLSSLINNMLLLAKTQKGLNDSQLAPVNTEELIIKLLDYFELIAEDRHLLFKKTGSFEVVLGDEGLLQRLFANLMSNAIHYAASDSVISVDAAIEDPSELQPTKPSSISTAHRSALIITITNRMAQPISQAAADKLFERFHRHHTTTNMHAGSGLGLSIVQAIAQAHDGTVSIRIRDHEYFAVSVKLYLAQV